MSFSLLEEIVLYSTVLQNIRYAEELFQNLIPEIMFITESELSKVSFCPVVKIS